MTDAQIWKEKDMRIARQSAIKASVNLIDVAERMGLLINVDTLEGLYNMHDKLTNKIYDKIYEGM